MPTNITDKGRLTVTCADRPGIVAAVSATLTEARANIVASDQFSTDPEGGHFFLRTEFHLADLPARIDRLRDELAARIAQFDATLNVQHAGARKRVALFASRYEHCLLDVLWRWRRDELPMEIVAVVSNHRDLEPEVEPFGVPFVHIPVTRETKPQAETEQLELLAGKVDVVGLARYMQILSGDFLERLGAPVINIHHSFLPAFAGADPYARAHARGVKLIGATAHYATVDLDEGPIIEQDVRRVSHRASPELLTQMGRDVERIVFVRALHWHLEDRVMVSGNRTVVFRPS